MVVIPVWGCNLHYYLCETLYPPTQSHILRKYLPEGYLPCGSAHSEVINTALELVQSLQHNSFTRLKSLLLYGPRGEWVDD